jgi:hypothetical protein
LTSGLIGRGTQDLDLHLIRTYSIPASMQSAARDLKEPSGRPSNQHSYRASHPEATDSASPRDSGGQLPSRGPSSLHTRDAAGVQNEDAENSAQLPPLDNTHHSVQFQSSSGRNGILLPEPAMQTAPHAGDDAMGSRPGTRDPRNPFPHTRFGLKKGEPNIQRCKSPSHMPHIL